MLRYFIHRVHQRRFAKPRMVICVPSGITGVEQRAVMEAADSPARARPTSSKSRWPPRSVPVCRFTNRPATWSWTSWWYDGGRRHLSRWHRDESVDSRRRDELDEALIAYVKKEFQLALGERNR